MPTYYLLQTSLCRDIEDGVTQKRKCAWRREYFRLEAGKLASVNECEDGLMWRSPPARLRIPQGAQPCPATEYEAALARWQAKQAPDISPNQHPLFPAS